LRVVFAGTPEFALPALAALLEHHDVAGVLTQPDRASGRGQRLHASPVKELAAARGLAVLQPPTLRDAAAQAELAALHPDALIVVAYGLILPPAVLSLPRLGCLNIHASLLPRWRGAAPIQRAILAGDARTGVTIMQMAAGLDTGPILLTRERSIAPDDTSGSLTHALAALGAAALLEALEGIARGTLKARPQPEEGVLYAHKIAKSEAQIDWSQDASSIDRQIRAFVPWPIAETTLAGERLRIHAAGVFDGGTAANELLKSLNSASNGSIVAVRDGIMLVKCGQASPLAIRSVQRPGGRVMTVSEFAHNLPLVGSRLG
jgi:methionyl-tRNA formyltransferase